VALYVSRRVYKGRVGVSVFLEWEICAGQCVHTFLGTVSEQAVDCNPRNHVGSSIDVLQLGAWVSVLNCRTQILIS
jgi:hypothetical protein